jgi:hypothetical protein
MTRIVSFDCKSPRKTFCPMLPVGVVTTIIVPSCVWFEKA